MSERHGARDEGLYLAFRPGDRVMTREGFPGRVDDVHEGPGFLTTSYFVTLDNGMGGGEYGENELSSLSQPTASGHHTAADDYEELGDILSRRLPPQIVQSGFGPSTPAQDVSDGLSRHPIDLSQVSLFSSLASAGSPDLSHLLDREPGASTSHEASVVRDDASASGVAVPHVVSGRAEQQVPLEVHARSVVAGVSDVEISGRGNEEGVRPAVGLNHARAAGGGVGAVPEVPVAQPRLGSRPDPAELGAFGSADLAPEALFDGDADASAADDHSRIVTAADWYPELGTILHDRLPIRHSVPASEYFGGKVLASKTSAALVTCSDCGKQYAKDYPEDTHEGCTGKTAGLADEILAAVQALFLPLDSTDVATTNEATQPLTQRGQKGYDDGLKDGRQGIERRPQSQDGEYHAGYMIGWAEGVETAGGVLRAGPDVGSDDLEERLATRAPAEDTNPMQPSEGSLASTTAGFWDLLTGSPEPTKNWKGPGHNWSHDWCRFRRDSRCYYPKEMNLEATEEAGYAVWIPEDRGYCPRIAWKAQEQCPVGEPGPNVPGGFLDATRSWEEGGQRGGVPRYDKMFEGSLHADDVEAASNLRAMAVLRDPEWGFHFTAAWSDVRQKAKRIRSESGVRILSVTDGAVTAQVRGDTNVYQTTLVKMPGRHAVASWECGCAWSAYSWGRSGRWKRFEGRLCSHALAVQYEVQSRGWGGKEVREDSRQPDWMDTSIPVKVPGDWDRDKARYSSLRTVAVGYEHETYDEPAPAHLMAYALLGEGVSREDVVGYLAALGTTDPAGIIAQAAKGSFKAKVRGIIRTLFIGNDGIEDDRGRPVPVRDILHPNYDPVAGLRYREARRFTSVAALARILVTAAGSGPQAMEAAAKAILEMARRNEPAATQLLQQIADANGGKMEGLDFRLKGMGSLLRKMNAETHQYGGDAGRTAIKMSDTLRYTMVADPERYADLVQTAISELEKAGYKAPRIKNYWAEGNNYKGINVAARTPKGHPFELQFHTPDSLRTKEKEVHPLYEEWRESPDEARRKDLNDQMRDLFGRVQHPSGVERIGEIKRMGTRRTAVEIKPGGQGTYTYYQRVGLSGKGEGVFRFYDGPDDDRVEVWRGGQWVVDNDYGRYIYKGDPMADEISEDEANQWILGSQGKQASLGDDDPYWNFLVRAASNTEPAPDPAPAAPLVMPQATAAVTDDEFGLSFSTLDDDPDAALPVTYGEDEDEDTVKQALLRAMSTSDEDRDWHFTPEERDRLDGRTEEAVAREEASTKEAKKDPHAWLLEGAGGPSDDVAAKAKEFLAKQSLKDFSEAERRSIINEGEGVTASNLDRLDIAGTHYESLEHALAAQDEEDPNGSGMWL